MRYLGILFGLALAAIPAVVSAADVEVIASDALGNITRFAPFDDYVGTASITAADVGTDGVAEIIVGAGPGIAPSVKVFRQDGSLINEFLAYHESYRSGITVAACDLDGDGASEIITGTMTGGGPHVRMFKADGTPLYNGGFFAYATDFRGGVNVACGDIDGDGVNEIITGPGVTGGPHIKVFMPIGVMRYEIFSGSASENTGASVAVGDVNGDGDDEIIAAKIGIGEPIVTTIDLRNGRLSFMLQFPTFSDYNNGIQLTAADIDGDGVDEIGVSTNRDNPGRVMFFEMTGNSVKEFRPFEGDAEKFVTATTIPDEASDRVIFLSGVAKRSDQAGKYIHVDISDQRLSAYENGALVRSFLVSTGLNSTPTPLGITEVSAKLPVHRYTWFYGPGNPHNYDVPGVKWNLRFRTHYYIHSATWHNNFGRQQSHGCVNVSVPDAEWIYNWADVGTPVEVAE